MQFGSAIWPVLIAVAPFIIYFVLIRPTSPIGEVGKNIDGFWERLFRRVKGYLTLLITVFGTLLIAVPEILTIVAGIDFGPILPQPWAGYVAPACMISLTLFKALQTTPPNTPPPPG